MQSVSNLPDLLQVSAIAEFTAGAFAAGVGFIVSSALGDVITSLINNVLYPVAKHFMRLHGETEGMGVIVLRPPKPKPGDDPTNPPSPEVAPLRVDLAEVLSKVVRLILVALMCFLVFKYWVSRFKKTPAR